MARILVSEWIPDECAKKYEPLVEWEYPSKEKHKFTREEMLELLPSCDACLMIANEMNKQMIDSGIHLKAIANHGVGYDNIDVEYATKKRIAVINTPKMVTEATAEHAAVLCFSIMRGLTRYNERIHQGYWKEANFDDGNTEIGGAVAGIVGMGRIGKSVAKRLQAFGMKILYYDPYRLQEDVEESMDVQYMPFDQLLAQADCVSLHLPYTKDNHHLFDESTFHKMKKGAYFVNCARGKIVDEEALARVLEEGHLCGAALDVFENEPIVNSHLLQQKNTILTPHVASLTYKTRSGMFYEAIDGILSFLNHEKPYNMVNPEIMLTLQFETIS